ncbi:hypothetical protein WMY93_018391 [Mugilogobius chulae]|uniref:ZMYM2-like/QRICH1 C-terminal domain-containing protein n=1 Tax=Mugilogobius chulae TaxID=88201 RepID=A0AAW0NU35_9GOBI
MAIMCKAEYGPVFEAASVGPMAMPRFSLQPAHPGQLHQVISTTPKTTPTADKEQTQQKNTQLPGYNMEKRISKKIDALAKVKGMKEPGQHCILTSACWSATTSASGEEVVSKWTSVGNHIQNVHVHDNALFPWCLHEPLQMATPGPLRSLEQGHMWGGSGGMDRARIGPSSPAVPLSLRQKVVICRLMCFGTEATESEREEDPIRAGQMRGKWEEEESENIQEQLSNKRHRDLTAEELKKIEDEKEEKNTKKVTKWAVTIFQGYLKEKERDTDLPKSAALSCISPLGLVRKVWWAIQLCFARRGREGNRQLSKSSFVLLRDDNGLEYVSLAHNPHTKNHANPNEEMRENLCGFMFETPGDPLCPVASFKKYIAKCPENTDAFYLKDAEVKSADVWYSQVPMGVNTLGNMLKSICEELHSLLILFAGVPHCASLRIYTNHCLRSTAVCRLSSAGLEARQIMSVTGHRCESSLRSYWAPSLEERKKWSNILSSGSAPETNATPRQRDSHST